MTRALREAVRKRARNRCEYCRLRQADVPFVRHQVEHVIPRQHGGGDDLANLALACYRCNKLKRPNLSGLDPRTNAMVPLFNPRELRWSKHFAVRGVMILGRTAIGRATVEVLRMNEPKRQNLRRELGR